MTTTFVARPTRVDLRLYQGNDFTMWVNVTNADGSVYDLSHSTPAAQIRAQTSEPMVAAFVCTLGVPGQILAHLPGAVSAAMAPGDYVYDLQITDNVSGAVQTLVGGTVSMAPEVTR